MRRPERKWPLSMTRALAIALILGASGLCTHSLADEPRAIPRIGVLMPPHSSVQDGLREGLRELGYIEGENIDIEWRPSIGTDQEMPALTAHLSRWKVDVIVVSTTPAALAAKRLTTLPMVLAPVSDPVGTGLAASLGKPGGNATGISVAMTDVTAKRLELLRLFMPRARRIGCLINSSNPAGLLQFDQAQAAARALGVQLIKLDARSSAELENVLPVISQSGAEEILITGDLLFFQHKTKLSRTMAKARLPAIFPDKEFLDGNDNALMSYGPNVRDAARRAAAYVDKILRGAKPADLPIEEISKYELVVNLRAARAIGLQIPEQLLLSADQVIR